MSVVSQFMYAPRHPHFEAVCHILRYLKSALGFGLLYRPLSVTGFSDADWASSQTNRRLTSCFCTFAGGNLVTRRSKKQTAVAHSSAKVE